MCWSELPHPSISLFLLVAFYSYPPNIPNASRRELLQQICRGLLPLLFLQREKWLIQSSLNDCENSHTCRRVLNWIVLHIHRQESIPQKDWHKPPNLSEVFF